MFWLESAASLACEGCSRSGPDSLLPSYPPHSSSNAPRPTLSSLHQLCTDRFECGSCLCLLWRSLLLNVGVAEAVAFLRQKVGSEIVHNNIRGRLTHFIVREWRPGTAEPLGPSASPLWPKFLSALVARPDAGCDPHWSSPAHTPPSPDPPSTRLCRPSH